MSGRPDWPPNLLRLRRRLMFILPLGHIAFLISGYLLVAIIPSAEGSDPLRIYGVAVSLAIYLGLLILVAAHVAVVVTRRRARVDSLRLRPQGGPAPDTPQAYAKDP